METRLGDTTRYCAPGLTTHFILTAFFAALFSYRIYKRAYYDPSSQIEAVDDFINQLPKAGLWFFQLAVNHQDPDYHHEL